MPRITFFLDTLFLCHLFLIINPFLQLAWQIVLWLLLLLFRLELNLLFTMSAMIIMVLRR